MASETSVIDENGVVVRGSEELFLTKRTEGTERADKAAPNKGVEKFWGELPAWDFYTEPTNVDIVIVPAIDGNFDASTGAMIPFERQFQTLHSLQNYLLTNELLAAGADARRGQRPPAQGAGGVRGALLRAPVLLHPRGHSPGAPGRGGQDPLSKGGVGTRCTRSPTQIGRAV